ncbi:DUF2892 domain-containing protein [Candidatus Albibeggiatoa sp. nov. BB20]|uniref:YgaP family membrane protein n=1 Tax=Candidatus Albibeggiatoa sp. nov. BB20 TaxID=3162723 RepID=UPI0033654AFD
MTVERIVFIVAGFMVLLSVALTHFVHPYFVGLTLFVGLNLFQSGFTKWCPLAIILKKLGMSSECQQATS